MTKEEHYVPGCIGLIVFRHEKTEIFGKFLQLQMFQPLEWDIYLIINAHQIYWILDCHGNQNTCFQFWNTVNRKFPKCLLWHLLRDS